MEGIDDAQYSPGTLRSNDEVVVQDGEGNVVHTPPPAAGLASGCCANALNGLVALNLFEKRKIGREWVFFLRAQNIAQ